MESLQGEVARYSEVSPCLRLTWWTEIRYPQPVRDDEQQRFISRAHITETACTAFEGTRVEVTARLIVRSVPDLNKSGINTQGELFTVWRYHAAFTDSPFILE